LGHDREDLGYDHGKEIATPGIGHAETVTQVEYAPDGKRLATASFDKTVKLWDSATYRSCRLWASWKTSTRWPSVPMAAASRCQA